MQDRKKETPIKWGERGLKFGAVLGGGAGALIYNVDQLDWNSYKQKCIKHGHKPASYLRPHLIPYVGLPLLVTAAFVGGTGYVAGKIHDKIQYPINQSIPDKPEKWANNGFKAGAGLGL